MIQPDEELVAAAQAGDHTALSTLYDRHFTKLYRFIYRHVNHVHDAEDLASEVMLRMVTHLPSFQRQSSFTTWLYGIARHTIADFWRKHYRVREQLVAEYAAIGATGEPVDIIPETEHDPAEKLRHQAADVFDRLPTNYRLVLQHRFIAQDSLEQTAAAMQISVGNVKVLQHRALKKAAAIAKHIV